MAIQPPRSRDVVADDVMLPEWPQWLLDKHGARVLRPSEAVRAPGESVPRSTVYRAAVLLFPKGVIDDVPVLTDIDHELATIGLTIRQNNELPTATLPALLTVLDAGTVQPLVPIPVPLVVSDQSDRAVEVDSWAALQQIRAGMRANRIAGNAFLDLIGVEHVCAGATYGGVPTWHSHDVRETAASAYPMLPVHHDFVPPVRSKTFPAGQRRVVVAVLDTGLNVHPWFGIAAAGQLPQGGFIRTYEPLQIEILKQAGRLNGLTPTEIIRDVWESPLHINPLDEQIPRALGHATAINGRIHQYAPEADILAVRILHTDNICYEADLLLALWLLIARVIAARLPTGTRDDIVDIISLSLGAMLEHTSPKVDHLRVALDQVAQQGIMVVAAAGNGCTTREFFPAGFSGERKKPPQGLPQPKVIGVGALNPDGTEAWFSNAGPNVSVNANGANLVCIFPTVARGSRGPNNTTKSNGRQTADPDRFDSGALLSGTSYAVAEVVAFLANELAGTLPSGAISDISQAAMTARATKLLATFP